MKLWLEKALQLVVWKSQLSHRGPCLFLFSPRPRVCDYLLSTKPKSDLMRGSLPRLLNLATWKLLSWTSTPAPAGLQLSSPAELFLASRPLHSLFLRPEMLEQMELWTGQLHVHAELLCIPGGQRRLVANGPHIPVDERMDITSVRGCGFRRDRLVYRRGCETKQVVPMQWHHTCYWQVDEEPEKERRPGCIELRKELPRSQSIPMGINVVEQESIRPEVQDRVF